MIRALYLFTAGLVLTVPLLALPLLAAGSPQYGNAGDIHAWSPEEAGVLRSLWIGSLPPLPRDPSNSHGDDPKAIALGKKLFSDTRFSGNQKVSCATCHQPDRNFTDTLPLAHGMGTTTRRSMPLIGMAYQAWFFWDGRKDSLWSQALGPLENPAEHGITRTRCAHLIAAHYRKEYGDLFGPPASVAPGCCPSPARPAPDDPGADAAWQAMRPEDRETINRIYTNMGKAIAAFVRRILPGPSRFDAYVEALLRNDRKTMEQTLSAEETAGLRLFIGKAKCINCHNGPLFTNGHFHSIAVPDPPSLPPDRGRAGGIGKVLADEFNCQGKYSDAGRDDCGELRFMDSAADKYIRAFKTPTLRNVAERPPYMHAGQFGTLREVLEHYRKLKPGQGVSREVEHDGLSAAEAAQIEAFLHALSGPLRVP